MFALADPNTIRLLRALSLDGPATARELATRLALRPGAVRQAIRHGLAVGVIRPRSDSADHYEIVTAAVTAAVTQHRRSLLGATA